MKIIFTYNLYFKNLINFNNLNISMKRNFRSLLKIVIIKMNFVYFSLYLKIYLK